MIELTQTQTTHIQDGGNPQDQAVLFNKLTANVATKWRSLDN